MVAPLSVVDRFAQEDPVVMCSVIKLVAHKRAANDRVSDKKKLGQFTSKDWTGQERSLILTAKSCLEAVCQQHNVGQVHVERLVVAVYQIRGEDFEELQKHFSAN